MVGSALVGELESQGSASIVTASRDELDLCNQGAVHDFLNKTKPQTVVVAAARVGGIYANQEYPAEFIYENLQISTNLIHGSWLAGVERLLFLGSSCIYPKFAPQPIKEDSLMNGLLEPTNEPYAVAKIAGLKLCEFYRRQYGVCYHSLMPTNLYGVGDQYHPENSHVIPGLIRRFHEAKREGKPEVEIWGTGTPRREFLNVKDLAKASVHMLGVESPPDLVNVGTGADLPILELANLISEVVGYEGEIKTDESKPDGTPRKLLDVSLIQSLGWNPEIDLKEGLKGAYEDFCNRSASGDLRE